MACRLTGTKPLSQPMLEYCKLNSGEEISKNKMQLISSKKMTLKMSSGKWRPFCLSLIMLRVSVCFSFVSPFELPHHSKLYLQFLYRDSQYCIINPLRAKFLRENINIYLHFMSFLHTDKTQVVEIPPWVRQGPAYSTQSISWLLMSWRRKEPGHQQPWYWPSWTELTRSPHVKG